MKEMATTDAAIAERVQLADYRQLEELYHVASDPDCLHNLIEHPAHQQAAEQLRGTLAEWMQRTADPLAQVFSQRHEPQLVADYMTQVQAEADLRRAGKRGQRKAKEED